MNRIILLTWKNRLLPTSELRTTKGEKVQIIDYGHQSGSCNIFNGAKVRIGDRTWDGAVVLHCKSSEWEEEIRSGEKCFDNTILHVTLNNDCDLLKRDGEEVHQLCLKCPDSLLDDIFKNNGQKCPLLSSAVSCSATEKIQLHGIFSRLLIERMEEKSQYIENLHEKSNRNWEYTLFMVLTRNFGFGIHSKPFEELASILDFAALGKHRDNILQVEAIIFGQAGLLNEDSIPYYYRYFATTSEYFKELKREFSFLTSKFNLECMDHKSWESANATPHVRLARLAAIFHSNMFNISGIAESQCTKELQKLIDQPLCGYWRNHTCFGGTETCGNGGMKQSQIEVIIINTVAPMLYIYGKHRKEHTLCEKSEDYLYSLRSEENGVIRRWREQGIAAGCAADSQALLQLSRSYCKKNRCCDCQLAYLHIRNSIECC